nr:enolase C-terminal domain-like protein [Jiangella aurantiaca]
MINTSGTEIADVVVTPVAFREPPLLNVAGVHQPWALRAIVEVRTTSGLTGLGETYGDAPHVALVRRAAATLTGLDAFDLHGLNARIAHAVDGVDLADRHGLTGRSTPSKTLLRVLAAFETACLDLQGQAVDRPVVDLLGGRARDAVPFSAYLFYKWASHPGGEPDEWGAALDPDAIVTQARRMIDQYGFRSIKLKGGVRPPAEEVDAIRALRVAFPEHGLRLDPNCAWAPDTAVGVATELADVLEYLEDPTSSIAGMAEVASRAPIPLATNMCVVALDDVRPAFTADAVQVVLADHHYWGGLRRSLDLAAVCAAWGVGVSMHSNSHLGISLAAMTHLAAAAPQLTYAADTHTPWRGDADVVQDPLSIVDGAVEVPHRPGLGVTLDRDALARMRDDYVRCGITERDDTGYLRTIDPAWEPRQPRW